MATACPMGDLAHGGQGRGAEAKMPSRCECQAQSPHLGQYCWVHLGCSLPIR